MPNSVCKCGNLKENHSKTLFYYQLSTASGHTIPVFKSASFRARLKPNYADEMWLPAEIWRCRRAAYACKFAPSIWCAMHRVSHYKVQQAQLMSDSTEHSTIWGVPLFFMFCRPNVWKLRAHKLWGITVTKIITNTCLLQLANKIVTKYHEWGDAQECTSLRWAHVSKGNQGQQWKKEQASPGPCCKADVCLHQSVNHRLG